MAYNTKAKIEDYLNFYNKLIPISKLKKQNTKDFLAFSSKENNPVMFGSVSNHVKYIPYDPDYFKFFQYNEFFWMIPLELPDSQIIGFIFKGLYAKEYRTKVFSKIPVFYGMNKFNEFKKNDLIILVEGSKDCLYIQNSIYPHTLAVNTSKLTTANMQVIRYLTNKVLLVYDNDTTGVFQSKNNKEVLQKIGVTVFSTKYELKDPGDYWFASQIKKDQFRDSLNKVISIANR